MQVSQEPLGDRHPFSDSRACAFKPLDQQHERLPVGEDLATLYYARTRAGKPWGSIGLAKDQPKAGGKRPTVALTHQPGRAKRKLRSRRRINPRGKSPVKRVALGRHAHPQPDRPVQPAAVRHAPEA